MIRDRRKAERYSQQELASRMGMGQSLYSQKESGTIKWSASELKILVEMGLINKTEAKEILWNQ